MLQDNSGGASSARVLLLIWGVGVLIIWAYICVKTGALAALPSEAVMVILGLSASKTVQRFGEKSVETTLEQPKT